MIHHQTPGERRASRLASAAAEIPDHETANPESCGGHRRDADPHARHPRRARRRRAGTSARQVVPVERGAWLVKYNRRVAQADL